MRDFLLNCYVSEDDDLYQILGCSRRCYQNDIHKAFRLWGLRKHPRGKGESRSFLRICNSYQVLADEDTKDIYDRYGIVGLSWDKSFSWRAGDEVFRGFFQRFGGMREAEELLKLSTAGWEGWDAPFRRLVDAQTLPGTMNSEPDFLPRGPLSPRASSAAEPQSTNTAHGVFIPEMHTVEMHSDYDGNPQLASSTKEQFLADFRRKTSFKRTETPKTAVAYSIAPYGMPNKEAALAEYRRQRSERGEVISTAADPKPDIYGATQEALAALGDGTATTMKEQWLLRFRERKQSGKALSVHSGM